MRIDRWAKIATGFDCPCCSNFAEFELVKPKGNFVRHLLPSLFVLETTMMVVCQDCEEKLSTSQASVSGASMETIALREASKHLLAGMAVADGHVRDEERNLIDQVLRKLGLDENSIEGIYTRSADGNEQDVELLIALPGYLPFLSLRSRCNLLEAAYHLAQVDAHLTHDEVELLQRIAKALKIPAGEFDILLDLAEEKQNFFDGFVEYFSDLEGKPACLPEGIGLQR